MDTTKIIRVLAQSFIVLFIIISFAVVFPFFYHVLNDKDRYPIRSFYPDENYYDPYYAFNKSMSLEWYRVRAKQAPRVTVVSDVLSLTVANGYSTLLLYNTVFLPPRFTADNVTTNQTFTVLVGTSFQTFSKLVNPFTMQQIAFNGTVNQYPFDKYVMNVTWAVQLPSGDIWNDFKNNKTTLYRYPSLEVHMRFLPQYVWYIDTKKVESDLTYLTVEFTFQRQQLFQLYPVFVFVALWLLTWSVLLYGSRAVIWDLKKLEAPVVGFLGALLVTVPSFRNTCPNAPPFGCLLDFASFYWAMLTVVITGIAVVVKYGNIHDNRAPAPAPPPAPIPVPQTESINLGSTK